MTLAGRICEYKADVKLTEARNVNSPRKRNELTAQALELYRQARIWWEKAANGDWNAVAHLGQFYEVGVGGVEKNEEEAERLYQEGASHGNALSMFFYGLLIDKKPGRHADAEKFIKLAATAGIPSARKWCKEHDVSFPEAVPDDDRQ
jgi:TPR repeat protein